MQDSTCSFPTKRGLTGYSYGCRCVRCRSDWADAMQRHRDRREGRLVPECRRCGDPLPPRHSKFCSGDCREASYGDQERVDRRFYTCAAPACHNVCMSSQREARFCSNPCKLAAKKIRRVGPHGVRTHPHWVMSQPVQGPTMDWIESLPMFGPTLTDWPMFGPTLTDWPMFAPTSAPSLSYKQCSSCGVTFMGSAAKRFCSDRCFRSPINDDAPESCDIKSGNCRRCGSVYVRPAFWDSNGCCSSGCTKRLHRSVRRRQMRARKRGQVHEPYTLREIAERDGWRCHLCGGRVPDRPYTAHDKDPTIDHLIPQSHGGDDIKSNVALAHNRCNWERGNAGLAQLRLVG